MTLLEAAALCRDEAQACDHDGFRNQAIKWREVAKLIKESTRLEQMLTKVRVFEVGKRGFWKDDVTIERCKSTNFPEPSYTWAVRWCGYCLNHRGFWGYEPIPSNRDDAFLAEFRFTTLEQAWEAAEKAIKKDA